MSVGPATIEVMRSVELFGGAGGLALGTEMAGFKSQAFVEWDRWACDTVRENKAAGYPLVANWRVHEGDVRGFDWSSVQGPIDLVAGGPPCQPFSMGGKARASDDKRDMFPAAADVVKQLQPRAVVLENVRGLTRSAFANYYQLILLRMQYPEITAKPDEPWTEHLQRLQAEVTSGDQDGLRYRFVPTLVNAADYGVPQHRHRVFMVGFRSDVEADWSFPLATHSEDALLHAQWVSGEYWERHRVSLRQRPELSPRAAARVRRLRHMDEADLGRPWQTVRDALLGLPEPALSSGSFLNHTLQPGARIYPGHTGSPIDSPAKTLKAGGHGVPGGENMLRRVDGSVRYFSVRESARLQTFPDEYELHGAWSEAMRQLGNAVPVLLAQTVLTSVAEHLRDAALRSSFGGPKALESVA